jgi:NADH:ubiquinone oxidoreductase subunit C
VGVLERIAAVRGTEGYTAVDARDGTPCVRIEASALPAFALMLRDECGFETNTFVTAIDRTEKRPVFDICYQFLSLQHADRLRVLIEVTAADPRVPTIKDIWIGASFSERECFDMFGVAFEGHDPLERLLMPEGYEHHPLRKEFPHHGIEPDRLYREWERTRSAGGKA